MLRTLLLLLALTGIASAQNSQTQQSDPSSPASASPGMPMPVPPNFAPGSGAGDPQTATQVSHGPIRISGAVVAGRVLTRVNPVYPPDAKAKGIQGSVILDAEIAKDGRVKSLRVVTGPPVLTAAAVEAVRQWTYTPYLLNGQPTEVRTTITVNFNLTPPDPGPQPQG